MKALMVLTSSSTSAAQALLKAVGSQKAAA